MSISLEFLRGLLILVVGAGLLLLGLYYWYVNTREERSVLVIKWIVSLVAITGTLLLSHGAGLLMVIFALLGGLVLAVLWTPTIAGWVVGKFDDLFTGGKAEVDPAPFYSVAEGRRKRGEYEAALAEVDRQLERFPDDLQGHLLRAEIHARDLGDLATAHGLLEECVSDPARTPAQVAAALTCLADWYLDLAHDPEAARTIFLQITARLPGTPQAAAADQRLARLAHPEQMEAARDRTPIALKPGVKDIGLRRDASEVEAKVEDPEVTIANLAIHLESYPHDEEGREELARLYAEHYKDLELAREQLEFLLRLPDPPVRSRVRWLHQLADFEIQLGHSYEGICATLQRIVDLNPESAAAQQARERMSLVRLNLKAREKRRAVPLHPRPPEEG